MDDYCLCLFMGKGLWRKETNEQRKLIVPSFVFLLTRACVRDVYVSFGFVWDGMDDSIK